MEYLELPDGSTSYLHLLKNKNTLWDINNQPQMYEVEIVHEINENFNKSFDDIININKVYCSICNLDVPKIYLKQHNKSSIHQNLIKLTDEVLDRTRKHLKTNDELNNASINVTDTFFCDICSKIIQNNNWNEHLESKSHKKQDIFEKLLSFFLEAYLKVNNEDISLNWEDLKDYMDNKNESSPLKYTSDLPGNISRDPSQIQNGLDPKASTDITKEVPVVNIFHPDYLKELLESGRNESYSPEPQNLKNLSDLQTSMESSKMDPGLNPVPKDNKSEHSDNQPNLNSVNPNLNPMNPNLNPTNPNLNPTNPNFHHVNPNLNPINLNLNPMNPNLNPTNPNLHHVNPMNPNLNPLNSIWNPMNPNFNPLNSNWNIVNPNFNAMNPNLNSMNPYFNPMNPNLNALNPKNPMNPNLHPMNPNFNPIHPYVNPMNPNLNTINPNLYSMAPGNKLGPNVNTIKPNLNPINPNLNPMDPKNPSHKLDPDFNPMEPQPKLGSNLMDPLLIAAETKKLIKAINKAERKREKQMKNIQAFKEFSSYINTIQEKYPSPGYKIEAVTVSKIKLTALNGDCVLVNRDHFESNNKKYCRVCQNGNLHKDHEMSEEHISRIMVPVADKNCIREIDDIWSHCIICNELIKFVEDHNKTAAHLANLKGCFINIPKQKEETDHKNIVSEEEGISILHTEKELNEQEDKEPDEEECRNVVDIEKRVNAEENKVLFKFDIDKFSHTLADKLLPLFAKYALTKEDATESNENNYNSTFESVESSKVKDNKNKVKQQNRSIQKDNKSITAEPKTLDSEVASNSSSTIKNITKYCSVCRLHVIDFDTHKTSESHTEISNRAKELKKTINRNSLKEVKDSVDLLKCDICNVNVNYNFRHINEHVYSENHRRNYFKFIGSNKIILIDQVESQCEPCNKCIPRSNIFDHCKQDKHVKKLKDFINIASSQTKPNQMQKETKSKQSTENKTVVQDDIDVTKMLYHFRAQGVEYLCKTCHALVSRDAASVKGHVESKYHVEKYNTLLRSNNIFKTAGSFHCEVCDAEIPMTGEITHVYGRNHNDNLVLKAKVAKDDSNGATAQRAIVSPVAGPSVIGTRCKHF